MGKKNKANAVAKQESIKTTLPKGGSAIAKNKPPKSPDNPKPQQKGKQPPKLEFNKDKKGGKVDVLKKMGEEKVKAASAALNGKKQKQNKKKNAQPGKAEEPESDEEMASDAEDESASDAEDESASDAEDEKPAGEETKKLSKRDKNRAKAEIKKEIILKGKSKLGLADVALVSRKLAKLLNKPEPRSVKAQKKIQLLSQLKERLEKANRAQHKDAKDKKKAPAATKPESGHAVFVGNMPKDVTEETLRAHFKVVGEIKKIKLPEARKRAGKRFGFIYLHDEETKAKFLEMHGTKMGERTITVNHANKAKATQMRNNAKLNTARKLAGVEVGKKKNKKNKKKVPKVVVK